MKTKIYFMLVIFISLIWPNCSHAQERVIHGVVTTFDSIPLIGASVVAQSTKLEVLTDSLGNYAISCKNFDKLVVSAHGFYDQKVKLNGKIKFVAINLKLKPGEKGGAVAIGYGHVADADRLNAVTRLNNEDLHFSQYNSIFDLIKGRCAGVQVIDNQFIQIRGINSIYSKDNSALVVVDGTPFSMDALKSIQPAQVKSIDVIKDSGAAIYGTMWANGVIIIETNRGGKK